MKHALAVCIACVLVAPPAASAHTWYVPGDASTIQEGLDLASPQHTVVVGPGTYVENIIMRDGVTLRSSGGPGLTIIQPAYVFEPIVRCGNLGPGTVIEGFTFQYGRDFNAAAIYSTGSAVTIRDNHFAYNYVYGDGGAVAFVSGTGGSIEDNVFEWNYAENWGGAILLEYSSPTVSGNTFRGNCAYFGGAIVCKYESSPDIAGNEFIENLAGKQGGAIHCRYDCSPSIRQNLFHCNEAGGSGGAMAIHEESAPAFSYNVFWGNSAWNASAVGVSFGSHAMFVNNTFYANCSQGHDMPATVGVYSGSEVFMENCIAAGSMGGPAIACYQSSMAVLDCNDFWMNEADYWGCEAGPNDFYEDPLFADPDAGDFSLSVTSPCADHQICGLVGAMGLDSVSPRTEYTTWGGIKAMYR